MNVDGFESLGTLIRKTLAQGERFTASGNFSVPADCYTVDVVIVGGGGNQNGGGGGGGETVFCKNYPVVPSASVAVVIGTGGGGSHWSAFGGLIASGGETPTGINISGDGGGGQNTIMGGGLASGDGVGVVGTDSTLDDALYFNENIISIPGAGGGCQAFGGSTSFGVGGDGQGGAHGGGASYGSGSGITAYYGYGGGGGFANNLGEDGLVVVTYKSNIIL